MTTWEETFAKGLSPAPRGRRKVPLLSGWVFPLRHRAALAGLLAKEGQVVTDHGLRSHAVTVKLHRPEKTYVVEYTEQAIEELGDRWPAIAAGALKAKLGT